MFPSVERPVGLVLLVAPGHRAKYRCLVVAALPLQLLDAQKNRLGLHHHARLASKRVVIDLTVFVERVIAQVVHADFDEPLLLGALEYRLVQRTLQQLGYDGQNVYSHGRISFW